jgi:hypothetical protein
MAQTIDAERPDQSRTKATNRANLLRLILIIVAIAKLTSAIGGLTVLFDGDPTVPGTSWGGLVVSAVIALSPLLALAALVFAIRGPIARAIIAIAGLALLDWLSYVPSVIMHWSDFPDPGLAGAVEIVQMVVLPLAAAAGAVLAWRGERLGLAALLALIPTIVFIVGVLTFGISIAIYGF